LNSIPGKLKPNMIKKKIDYSDNFVGAIERVSKLSFEYIFKVKFDIFKILK